MQKIDTKYFQGYKPIKKEDKNSRKNKSTNTPLLMYLVENNNLIPTKTAKRTRTTKEILGVIVNKSKVESKTFLQLVSTSLPKNKKKTFLYQMLFIQIEGLLF